MLSFLFELGNFLNIIYAAIPLLALLKWSKGEILKGE